MAVSAVWLRKNTKKRDRQGKRGRNLSSRGELGYRQIPRDACHLRAPVRPKSQPVFLHLAVERGEPDLEQSGRLGLVAVGVTEHLDDVVALYAFQVKRAIPGGKGLA